MPIRLINPQKAVKWIHPDERGKPDATVFHIVALTEGKARELRNEFILNADGKPDVNGFKMKMFLESVKMIENVIIPGSSEPRTLSDPADIRLFLDCLPVAAVQPIYDAMQNMSDLDEGTLKN